ncbi:MAG: hypothetical protein MJ053_01410 [Elusimicrobiaceae bacterium]|nr:hypothetical protein [Elusimicrobiaceae bacterium]
MKVEIKKVGIMPVLFSVFPLAVFVVMLLSAFLELFNPDVTLNMSYAVMLVLRAIEGTLLFLVATVFFLWVYNGLCALGIRGIHVELEDK